MRAFGDDDGESAFDAAMVTIVGNYYSCMILFFLSASLSEWTMNNSLLYYEHHMYYSSIDLVCHIDFLASYRYWSVGPSSASAVLHL